MIYTAIIGYVFAIAVFLFGKGFISFIFEARDVTGFVGFILHILEMWGYIFIAGGIGFFIGLGLILNASTEYVWRDSVENIKNFGVIFLLIFVSLEIVSYVAPELNDVLAQNSELYLVGTIIVILFPISNIIFGFGGNMVAKKLCEASDFSYIKIINATTKSGALDLFKEGIYHNSPQGCKNKLRP
jgi:hypothetical protein